MLIAHALLLALGIGALAAWAMHPSGPEEPA
jgi:hypothetical protein